MATYSSSIASKLKSPTSSTSPLTNGYLNSLISPLPRVAPAPPTQEKQAPPSLDYVPGPEHPPSPDYVPVFEYPPSPNYVPGPEYSEYLVSSDDEAPIEDQPLPADYVADFDLSEEDPEEDPDEYPADRGDDDDNDDDDDDEEEEEASEEHKEEEHLDSAESTTLPAIDPFPSVEDTEAFDIDESAPTPRYASAPTPPSPPPSPLTTLSSLLPQIPSPPLPLPSPPTHTSHTYTEAPLGYKAAMIRSSAASPLPLPAPSSPLLLPATAAAARQPGLDITPATNYRFVDTVDATPRCLMSIEVGYQIMDVWDDMVEDLEGRPPTTLEELSQRVTDLAATLARDTHEMAVHAELLAYQAEVRALHEQIGVLQRQIQQG
ncbi:hypothetical protein Tco_0527678 [Tanacetum coccineum]